MKKKVGIAVQLNRESAHAVKWAVSNCVGPHDTVTLIHVKPTQSFHGADWGDKSRSVRDRSEGGTAAVALRTFRFSEGSEAVKPVAIASAKDESLRHGFRSSQGADELLEPLQQANVPYTLHIVEDHDAMERICLEAQRLKLDALIICRERSSARRRPPPSSPHTSAADYCIDHCDCPVIVVPYDDDEDDGDEDHDADDDDAADDDERLSTSSHAESKL